MSDKVQSELLLQYGLKVTIVALLIALIIPKLLEFLLHIGKTQWDLRNHGKRVAIEHAVKMRIEREERIRSLERLYTKEQLELMMAMRNPARDLYFSNGGIYFLDEKKTKFSNKKYIDAAKSLVESSKLKMGRDKDMRRAGVVGVDIMAGMPYFLDGEIIKHADDLHYYGYDGD